MAYCQRCDRSFGSRAALRQHEADSSHHNVCEDCSIDFPTWTGLKEHWVQSRRHAYCQYCNMHFVDSSDLEDHYEECHSYCASCKRVFTNEYGLQEHYRQSNAHYYCLPCERHFQPRSALVSHLESGRCLSGIDRTTIKKLVHQYDKNNTITDPDGDKIKRYANRASWNGSGYECPLHHCVYATLAVLKQHLGSPIHEDKVYVCPGSACQTRFPTLSALCQHIESERCDVFQSKVVQRVIDKILGQIRRLFRT